MSGCLEHPGNILAAVIFFIMLIIIEQHFSQGYKNSAMAKMFQFNFCKENRTKDLKHFDVSDEEKLDG